MLETAKETWHMSNTAESRPLDQQQRMPDGQTFTNGHTLETVDDNWQTTDAVN